MRKLYTMLFTVLSVTTLLLGAACKKGTVEDLPLDQQQDLVVLAMTSGKWQMSWFKEDNVPVAEFTGYEFQYYKDFTVDADKNGMVTRGTWGGNSASMTTSAQFPASAGNPLLKLNGTWNITRNGWTFVEAKQIEGAVLKTMRLDKK
jgi:hypothetical protein